MINRAIKGRVRVEVAAEIVNLLRHGGIAARGRSLEHHVFEEMGDAAAEKLIFVNAAGCHPILDRNDRCGKIALDENVQAIGQFVSANPRGGQSKGTRAG